MNHPKLEDYFIPIKDKYSIEEIDQMRKCVIQIMYMEDGVPCAWPMPEYPEDYIANNLTESRLRTYMVAGVPLKVMQEFVEKRKKELDEKYPNGV